ncbi:hypothetical protein ACIRL2_45740 [Embleya sp. NPDC127516]|uniref:hypothetical protein n=1 Tax=Embleya sp. NPDC127516 TaxID=3363990 RepID=UPI0037FA2F4D
MNTLPGPGARRIDAPPPATTPAAMAGRLQALLGIPIEFFEGMPGTGTEGRARDLLDVDPYLAVRAPALMNTVMRGREPALDTALIIVASPELSTDHMDRAA